MTQSTQWFAGVTAALLGTSIGVSNGFAQANLPVASAGDQVVIKRELCRVVEPQKFRVPLSLEAGQTVTLVAPFDGTVKQLAAKVNSKVQALGDVVRLDNTTQKLHLAHAQAALKVASLQLKQAEKEEAAAELAQAKLDLVQVDVEIAKLAEEQTKIRAPFACDIQRILVAEGQFVRAGDPVAIVADNRMMKVEIPVDRAAAESGKSLPIKIEQLEVEGKVEAVLPLPAKFDGLRELFDSIASVQLTIDNPSGKLKVGQTVYVPLIPRQPVVEVPNSSVGNLGEGQRKVQVVRQFIVRDVPVTLLGQVGASRVFVSGPFADGDEVIYETSHQLGDAYQLKPSPAATAAAATSTTTPATGQPAATPSKTPTKPAVGF